MPLQLHSITITFIFQVFNHTYNLNHSQPFEHKKFYIILKHHTSYNLHHLNIHHIVTKLPLALFTKYVFNALIICNGHFEKFVFFYINSLTSYSNCYYIYTHFSSFIIHFIRFYLFIYT